MVANLHYISAISPLSLPDLGRQVAVADLGKALQRRAALLVHCTHLELLRRGKARVRVAARVKGFGFGFGFTFGLGLFSGSGSLGSG